MDPTSLDRRVMHSRGVHASSIALSRSSSVSIPIANLSPITESWRQGDRYKEKCQMKSLQWPEGRRHRRWGVLFWMPIRSEELPLAVVGEG